MGGKTATKNEELVRPCQFSLEAVLDDLANGGMSVS